MQTHPSTNPAEVRRCIGLIILDGIFAQCPESFTARKNNTSRLFHSDHCKARASLWQERGFALGDRYVKTCQNAKCPLPERKFTPGKTFLQDYCTAECRTQADYWRDPEPAKESARAYYRDNRVDILGAHAHPTGDQLKSRHKAEHNYRKTHKPQIEIQTAQRFIKKHGDVALPPDLTAKLAEAKRLKATALPTDWSTKPEGWVFIGLILLQRDYMSNDELAVCLDASKGPACHYSEDGSWGIITRPGRAANYITAIRRWVGRPGKSIHT
jgi:hypothetical protein